MSRDPFENIAPSHLPDDSFLHDYQKNNNFTDCYKVLIHRNVSGLEFVEAFYTSWLFRLERLIIAIFVLRPSTDKQLLKFLRFQRPTFSAWTIERSSAEQWLMCDYQGKTRSWFMVKPFQNESITELYFGTAILANAKDKFGNSRLTLFFRLLLLFHRHYAIWLLNAAKRRLEKKSF